jgi:hypothetical protein
LRLGRGLQVTVFVSGHDFVLADSLSPRSIGEHGNR